MMASLASTPVPVRHVILFVLIDGIGDCTIQQLAKRRQPEQQNDHTTHTPINNEYAYAASSSSSSSSFSPGLTPLESARVPDMDLLARHGLVGLMDSVESGQACGSDTAHMSILGYDPLLFYRGRGAFESIGAGLEMRIGDVAFKSNFATIHPHTGIVTKRRADRQFHEWGIPLCGALDGVTLPNFPDVAVSVRYATEHRCGVRIRGSGLTDCITGTDPLVDGKPLRVCRPTDSSPEAARTSAVVNEVSNVFRRILAEHPINIARVKANLPPASVVLLRGAGARVEVEPFHTKGLGRGCMVAPTAIIAGLGESLGLERIKCEKGTGDYRTDLIAKAKAMLGALRTRPTDGSDPFDFGFLHIKAVDDAGHDRDLRRKIEFLEKTDEMIRFIIDQLKSDEGGSSARDTLYTLVVTGDHSTPLVYGDHSTEPVPFLVTTIQHLPEFQHMSYSPSLAAILARPAVSALGTPSATDPVIRRFDEIECARGSLGRFPGREVTPMLRRIKEIFQPTHATHTHPTHTHADRVEATN